MSNTVSIVVAWGTVFGVFGIYLLSVLKRTRSTAKLIPVERQRWMTTDTPTEDPKS